MAASINLKVRSEFDQASKDLKAFGNLSDKERQRVEKYAESFKSEQLDAFMDRNRRAAAAVKATSGTLAANQAEYKGLQRQIQTLIRRGLDPQDDALKPLITRYKQLEQEIEDSADASAGASRKFSTFDGIMVGVGSTLVNVAREGLQRVVEFTRESADAASAAEETFAKFYTVFRDETPAAQDAVDELASSFGLASSTAATLLGDTGDLLTGFGFTQEEALKLSEEVNTLAVDLASFTNFSGGAAGASEALTKALLGEAESAKSLGIVIRQNDPEYKKLVESIKETRGVTEQQARAYAALETATRQSQNAIGDYERTSESAANVQRRYSEQVKELKENTGELVLEGLTPLRSAFAGLLTEVNKNIERSNTLRSVLRQFGEEGEEAFDDLSLTELQNQYDSLTESLERLNERQARSNIDRSTEIRQTNEAIDQIEAEIAARNRSGEVRRQADAYLATLNDRAEENAEAEARNAEIHALAWAKRLEIQEEYGEKVEQMREEELNSERTRIQQIQDARREALEDAANSAVRTGEEIAMINEYYGNLIAEEQQRARDELDEAEQEVADEIIRYRQEAAEASAQAEARRLEKYKESKEQEKEAARAAKEAAVEFAWESYEASRSILESLGELWQAQADKQIAELDRAREFELEQLDSLTQARLEAAGVAEETEIERIQRQLDEALEAGDKEKAAELEKELTRTKILEEAEKERERIEAQADKKRANLEYKAAMRQWKLQKVLAAADAAAAVIKTMAGTPFPWNIPLAAAQAAAGLVQIAAINQAKPQKPTAQTGTGTSGITIPDDERSTRQDNVAVMASPGETVNVSPRGQGNQPISVSVSLEGRQLIRWINDSIESGEIRITADNIQGGIS